MSDVFLSYKSDDRAFATRVAEGLIAEGVSVWWDPDLRGGDTYDQIIEERLRAAKCAVVLWSAKSAASRWVRAEATVADRRGTLLPVMSEACERPLQFELVQSEDLIGWKGDRADPRWQKFVARVREKVGEASAAPSAPSKSATMEAAYWDELNASGGAAEDYQAYLKRFPQGGHSAAVEQALQELVADNKKRRRTMNLALVFAAFVVVSAGVGGFWYLNTMRPHAVQPTSAPAEVVLQLTPQDMVGAWIADDATCEQSALVWNVTLEGDNQAAALLVWRREDGTENREQIAEVLADGAVKTMGAPRADGPQQIFFYTLLPDGRIEASFRDHVSPAWRYRRCG